VSQDSFELECDRLSQVVDAALFERLRWERTEGPMLARLVALAQSVIEGRAEFELTEEGATSDVKRFILKVHSNRVVAIRIWLENGQAVVRADEIQRSKYRLLEGPPLFADFEAVDEQWMSCALQELFRRVQC
jgi:hypothetical protein